VVIVIVSYMTLIVMFVQPKSSHSLTLIKWLPYFTPWLFPCWISGSIAWEIQM
jgi:hypothetical protein